MTIKEFAQVYKDILNIKNKDKIRYYVYKDRIDFEVIENSAINEMIYAFGFDIEPETSSYDVGSVYISDNKIAAIENPLSVITKTTIKITMRLMLLVGLYLDDFEDYPKLKEIEELDYDEV